jgi:hypothetical protein
MDLKFLILMKNSLIFILILLTKKPLAGIQSTSLGCEHQSSVQVVDNRPLRKKWFEGFQCVDLVLFLNVSAEHF